MIFFPPLLNYYSNLIGQTILITSSKLFYPTNFYQFLLTILFHKRSTSNNYLIAYSNSFSFIQYSLISILNSLLLGSKSSLSNNYIN